MMHPLVCKALLLASTTLSSLSTVATQERPRLDTALLIERGPELVTPPPSVRWVPGGHSAGFELNAVIGLRDPGAEQPVTLIDGRTLLTRIGVAAPDKPATEPALGEVSLPPWSFHDSKTLRVVTDDAVWHLPLDGNESPATRVLGWPVPLDQMELSTPLRIAPGDLRAAYVHDHDLHVTERDGAVRRLTWDGSRDLVYGGAAHRAEFGITGGLFWSGDGRYLAFYREDQRPIARYPYMELAGPDTRPRHGRYPMAGRTDSVVTVGVYDAVERSLCWLEHDPAEDLYWTNITFARDGDTLTVALVSRGQDRMELVRFDRHDGRRLATLLVESDPQWVEPEHGPTFLQDGRFLWWSVLDGHRHLYLHDRDGKRLGQVTKGAFDVQELLGVADDDTRVWFSASGEDPRQKHLFSARIDGGEVRQITRERGSHDCELSPDHKFAFVLWSDLDSPPTPRFLDLENGAVEPLPAEPPPLSLLELPAQRSFQVKASDDTVLYGHVLMPQHIAEGTRLPALLYVYGGPHVQLVQDRWMGAASPWLMALANEGYVVCRLDNHGTPHRGIEFEQSVHRRLGEQEVLDQLRAVEWLKQQPFVDPARIGVHGWSYGGYMTLRLLLKSPDTFACGVSGAPVTDWRQYETGYGERYMDTPAENPAGYEASSCLPLAGALKTPLLIVHGTDDRTVMWSHTLEFVDRCVDAGVFVDYMPYPQQTHRLVGKDRAHFQRLLKRYLDQHLQPAK